MKNTNAGYRLLAAKYVRRQTKQLGRQFKGIRRAEDVEFIHRARVASRRLRAALRMFDECFPGKQLKRWRKESRRLTTELGEARDTDVQIVYLDHSLRTVEDDACYAVLAQLLSNWQQQRDRLQPRVLGAIDRFREQQVLKQMKKTAKETTSAARAEKACMKSDYVFSRNQQQIVPCLDAMLDCRHSLEDPAAVAAQHAMRIAAKRLRYSLEIVASLYDGALDEQVAAVRKLQTRLGNMRDCDVWIEHLQTFERQERERIAGCYGHSGPFARFKPGVELLLNERRESRQQLFQKVVDYWVKLNKAEQWQRMVDVLQRGGREQASAVESEG